MVGMNTKNTTHKMSTPKTEALNNSQHFMVSGTIPLLNSNELPKKTQLDEKQNEIYAVTRR